MWYGSCYYNKKENISIQNLKIEQCNDRADQPAVLVTGDNHSINEVEVHASYIGMKLEDARNIKIENSILVGQKREMELIYGNRTII